MHANRIHVNTVELVQRMELITNANVCLGIKEMIVVKVGIVFLLLIAISFLSIIKRKVFSATKLFVFQRMIWKRSI